jgi:2'-hydroxyisoflavone reductase
MRRRRFLQASGAIALAGLAPGHAAGPVQPARRPLRILILGGTRFLGLHMTQYALDRGHRLTFFNRGRTNTDRFPQIERIKGDRNGELGGLAGREWDAVIDNSGYVPRHVRLAAQMLRASVPHYLFVSTLSVYVGFASANAEDSPLGTLAAPATETVDGATYGPLKALCETAARDAYGAGNTTILRPGLIVGPDDNTDRFTYWPARATRGGRFIAPGKPADPIQLIDARDLAAFAIETLERRVTGTFNAVSAPSRFTMGELIDESVAAARSTVVIADAPQPVWVPADFLAAQKILPWSDMPVWVPSEGETAGFAATTMQRAAVAGLRIRPLADTVRDTLRWHRQRPTAEQTTLKAGLAAEREAAVLAAFLAAPKP